MIKYRLMAALLILVLCFSACESQSPQGAVYFYYRTADDNDHTENGIIGMERHVFPEGIPAYDELLNLYFEPPTDPGLISPFPKGLRCVDISLDDGILTVILSNEFGELIGIERSIAAACITKTLTQFESVSSVCLETNSDADGGSEVSALSDKDYVLLDLGAVNTETAVRLYFSDVNGRYLVSAERKNYFSDSNQIPAYVMQQLIEGPAEAGQLSVVPEGTALRGISVDDNGVCTVDLSSAFLFNKPSSEALERMTVLSIVNSLTELDSIKRVRFLVEGVPVVRYVYMDLSFPYQRDESAIGVVRSGLNETDATLYVHGASDEFLTAVPVCIRKSSQMSLPEMLLQKLIAFEEINGLENPLPVGTSVQSVEQRGTVCYVDFSSKFLGCAGNEIQEQLAVRSVVATLTTLDEISSVKISVNGAYRGFQYFDLNENYIPQADWFY